jgi:DHA1 family inner membrane transport protein
MSATTHAQTPARERAILLTLAVVQFTHVMDFMIMMPLGSHLMRVFSITPGQFSYLVAAYGLTASVSGFGAGFFLDRIERKRALLTLYTGFGLATLACALAPNYSALLAARAAAGAFGGVASSVLFAMVGDVVPAARRGRGMAVVGAAFPLASVLGVPLGLYLAGRFEWHAPFFLLSALSVVVLLLGLRVLPVLRHLHPPAHPWVQMRNILTRPVHRRAFLMSAMLVFAGACVIPFLAPSMVANVGLNEEQLPYIYLAGGLCTFATTPLFGRLSDRHDKLHVLGWLSVAAGVAVLIITNLPAASVPVAMLATAGFMVTMSGRFSPALAMVTNAVEARYRGGFMSVNSAVQQAASGLANLTAGLLVTETAAGHLAGYPWVGVLSLVCFGLTYFLGWRLRALAPHSTRPGHHVEPQPIAAE